jgi:hypothetical protein
MITSDGPKTISAVREAAASHSVLTACGSRYIA